MELKLMKQLKIKLIGKLLIVPYGIEMNHVRPVSALFWSF